MPFALTAEVAPERLLARLPCRDRRAPQWPGSEWAVFRTLQLANFNTPLLFDEDEQLREVLSVVDGSTPSASSA